MNFHALFTRYQEFLAPLPEPWPLAISLTLFAALVFLLVSLVRRSLIWLILLVLVVPASLPLLQDAGQRIWVLFQ